MDNADIDFKEIAKTILRQKKLVSIISVLSLTTGIIYSFREFNFSSSKLIPVRSVLLN